MKLLRTILGFALAAFALACLAQSFPAPQEGTWLVRDFGGELFGPGRTTACSPSTWA